MSVQQLILIKDPQPLPRTKDGNYEKGHHSNFLSADQLKPGKSEPLTSVGSLNCELGDLDTIVCALKACFRNILLQA